MKRAVRNWIIVAVILIAVGIGFASVAIFTGMLHLGEGKNPLASADEHWTAVTHEVSGSFTDIEVAVVEHDVRFVPSEDGKCSVVCPECERVTYEVKVDHGTLIVRRNDDTDALTTMLFDFLSEDPALYTVTIRLPKSSYDDLTVSGVSGGVSIPEGFSFRNVDIALVSGDITSLCAAGGTVSFHTTSGAVRFENAVCGTLKIETVSGDMEISSVSADRLDTNCTSGSVSLENVTIAGKAQIHTVSGDVDASGLNVSDLEISTTSGAVSASLLRPTAVSADTVSGDVNVPAGTGDAICSVNTVSGDITVVCPVS